VEAAKRSQYIIIINNTNNNINGWQQKDKPFWILMKQEMIGW